MSRKYKIIELANTPLPAAIGTRKSPGTSRKRLRTSTITSMSTRPMAIRRANCGFDFLAMRSPYGASGKPAIRQNPNATSARVCAASAFACSILQRKGPVRRAVFVQLPLRIGSAARSQRETAMGAESKTSKAKRDRFAKDFAAPA